jgi:hypothetical protein
MWPRRQRRPSLAATAPHPARAACPSAPAARPSRTPTAAWPTRAVRCARHWLGSWCSGPWCRPQRARRRSHSMPLRGATCWTAATRISRSFGTGAACGAWLRHGGWLCEARTAAATASAPRLPLPLHRGCHLHHGNVTPRLQGRSHTPARVPPRSSGCNVSMDAYAMRHTRLAASLCNMGVAPEDFGAALRTHCLEQDVGLALR